MRPSPDGVGGSEEDSFHLVPSGHPKLLERMHTTAKFGRNFEK